jgi:hypothetical protein
VSVETDESGHNTLIASERAADDTLTRAGTCGTGGEGAQLAGVAADPLASQGALTLVKLREVARSIAGTGELKPGQGPAQETRRRCDEGRVT